MRTHYEVLGVEPTACLSEIKKAHTRLVKAHHPDVGGDPAYFSLIQEAYTVLRDEDLRDEYDMSSAGLLTNDDIIVHHDISLEDSLTGASHEITYNLTNGESVSFEISIPKNVKHNTFLKYPGMGDNLLERLPRGDLYVKISIVNNTDWIVNNNDIATTVNINLLDFLVGCDILLTTPDGRSVSLTVSPSSPINGVVELKKEGLDLGEETHRGDLYVFLNPVVPKITDKDLYNDLVILNNRIKEAKDYK